MSWYCKLVAAFALTAFPADAYCETNVLPDSSQFMGMLTTCAAGSRTRFEADLIGSIRGIYEGQKTKGYAQLRTESEFMRLLPEDQKLEGYRLYVECIKAIVIDPAASKVKAQFSFLEGYRRDTPITKVVEVFGQASKVKDLYDEKGPVRDAGSQVELRWFEGAKVDFFVAISRKGHVLGAGVYGKAELTQARLPYLNLGTTIGKQELRFSTLADFQFRYIGDVCQFDAFLGGHARFRYMITPICYFGAPGGYMNYEFVFQPNNQIISNCKVDFDEKIYLKSISCSNLKMLQPMFGFVFFTEGILPEGISDRIMEWIYNFAQ
jgi:hypothetical protein